MMTVLYFDICAAIVLITLIFSVVFKRMTGNIANKLFILVLVFTLTANLFDLVMVGLDRSLNARNHCPELVLFLIRTGYLLFHNLTVSAYLLFIIGLTDTWHKLKRNKLATALCLLPSIAVVALLVSNFFTRKIFSYAADGRYTRGPWVFLLYACAFINMAICTVYLVKHRKFFSGVKLAALFAILPMVLTAVVIQGLNPALRVEMFVNAVAMFLVTAAVQRPEELMDSITGLRKYDAYAEDMKKNFVNEKHITVIMINLSNFKSLHDILSFDGTNELLKKIALKLSEVNRKMKVHGELYYLDRGRFRLTVSEAYTNLAQAAAEEINSVLKQSIVVNGFEMNLLAYVCIAKCPEDIGDFKTLMRFGYNLDKTSVFSGQVMYVSDVVKTGALELTDELDTIIDEAIANKRFQIYYQPIYSIREKRYVSAEALVRLVDERHGFISPDLFITAAERSGAILKIGDYILEEVCRFIAEGDFERLGLDYIEVNLSVAQCMQSNLSDKILQVMRKYGVSPDKINLEITETAADYAQDIMMENINRLFEAGISFSLDDYGTGYSNIQRIVSLPLKIVKLDKSFVDAADSPKMRIVLHNTIKMLKELKLHIVVEGVETNQHLEHFTKLECDYIQGYYFSKPVPEREFIKLVESGPALCE